MEQIKKLFEEIDKGCTFGEISLSGIYFSIPVKVDTSNIDLEKLKEEIDDIDDINLISPCNDMVGYELSNKIDELPVSKDLLEKMIEASIDHEEDELDGDEEKIEEIKEIKNQNITTIHDFLTAIWQIYDGWQSMSQTLMLEEVEEGLITFKYGDGE